MTRVTTHLSRRGALLLLLLSLLATLLPVASPAVQAQIAPNPVTVDLESIADARIQGGSPDVGFGSGFIWVGSPNGHLALVQFDLLALPANATISSAELRLTFTGTYTPTANVEVGRNEGAWDEATITWNTRPANAFNGNIQVVGDTAGVITWNVTNLVQQWQSGAQPNYGFALRGDGPLKAFHSRETLSSGVPRLVVTYSVPPTDGAHPDLGDAPDSSNSVGVNPNTAYPGVPGNFPTVWAGTPAGQPAGPRHTNVTLQGILGNHMSREAEADSGPDADTANNILDGGADNADNDRGDDGWRNRNANFTDCEQTTLRVRVRKAAGATIERMFLNVWFDGNHNGIWGDRRLCTPDGEALAIPATEWIVQDYYVDMTGIPAGGYVDIDITTETVLNSTPNERHWMRFTLSDIRAPQNANGRADGRGPHPNSPQGSYQFGETEDVLQRPQPPGEDGTLELSKRVITDTVPTQWIDYVTYEITLTHSGGSQPIQARIRDELPYPLIVYPRIVNGSIEYIIVDSPTGGASPLAAVLDVVPPQGSTPPQQVITWQGTLAPNSTVRLTFQVRVLALCEANQQTMVFTNTASARPRGGAIISASDDFTAACINYNGVFLDAEPLDLGTLDPTSLLDYNERFGLRGRLRNTLNAPITLGVFHEQSDNSGAPQITAIALPSFQKLTLQPGETREIDVELQMDAGATDELTLPDEYQVNSRLRYCILPNGEDQCPSEQRYPQLWGASETISFKVRPNDLGDAPDSTNHAGAAMAAYPGVQANYPTVFDPATGLPPGPLHAHPRAFHLGERVSREAEADLGPDEDPTNNILPAANQRNRDRFDDGANPHQWALNHCQTTTIPVRIAISNAAWNWFVQQQQPAYLNTWLDANRDGDWGDGTGCGGGPDGGGQPAVEHIVIDQPIDVIALGPGLHTVNVPTGLVPWPAQFAQQPSWVRVTLSERVSNKTLQLGGLIYGDGRGYQQPSKLGETEDYLAHPEGVAGAGPDLGVELSGRSTFEQGPNSEQVRFRIDYANLGSRPARGGSLTFTIPAQLRGLAISMLDTGGIPDTDITETNETVTFALPDLQPGEERSILIGIDTFSNIVPAGDYLASVIVSQNGDTDPSNNQDQATITRPQRLSSLAILAGNGSDWSRAELTCRDTVRLTGVSVPNTLFNVLLDGDVADGLVDGDTIWLYDLDNLSDGIHDVQIDPLGWTGPLPSARVRVDSTLPVDPISLTFTDSQGRIFHPPTLGWNRAAQATTAFLQPGETYEIAIDSCLDDPNQQIELRLPNGDELVLTDTDGDGRYTASLVFDESGSINAPSIVPSTAATPARLVFDESGSIDASSFQRELIGKPPVRQVFDESGSIAGDSYRKQAVAPVELSLNISGGGVNQRFGITIAPQTAGSVIDRSTGQPIAGAAVTALATLPSAGTSGAWPAAALGQPNPQTTGANGGYTHGDPGSASRLLVTMNGYQPFRSFSLDGAALNTRIALTPNLAGPTTHTVSITPNGFSPSVLKVAPGDVIEWVNLSLDDHSTSAAAWESGALGSGQSYRVKLSAAGTYSYSDGANPGSSATVIVEGFSVMLPVVVR